jgi:SMP-30/Gluconolactonase/LRE-like region
MGTTNGIDLSPDENTLYVGESNSGEIWSYTIRGNELIHARLVSTFESDTIDGVRTDVAGKLLVARILKGTIAIIKPNGSVQKEIQLKGKEPTNLVFGGADGRTVFLPSDKAGTLRLFVQIRKDASTVCSGLFAKLEFPARRCRSRALDPVMRSVGILNPGGAGQRTLAAGFGQIELTLSRSE